MTIYATPFNTSDLQTTGPSIDSGFDTLEAVTNTMGNETRIPCDHKRVVIYGDDVSRVAFSDFIFNEAG